MTSPPPAEAPPADTRPDRSFGEVVRGVVVLAVGVLVAVWVGALFRNDPVVEPDAVDYLSVADQARRAADFPLAVPNRLPDGWRATSARWDPFDERWHLGVLTDNDKYVGVEQSADEVSTLVAAYADGASEAGAVDVQGRPWRRFVDEQSGEVALVREQPLATILVTGSAPENQLVAVATGLVGR